MTGIYIYLNEGDEVRVERGRHPDDVSVRVGDVTLYMHRTTAAALGEALRTPADETE